MPKMAPSKKKKLKTDLDETLFEYEIKREELLEYLHDKDNPTGARKFNIGAFEIILLELAAKDIEGFLDNFTLQDDEGRKKFEYAEQLTAIAHREQVSLTIDLDDVTQFDEELAESIQQNAHRYYVLVADVIESLLPEYKDSERQVPARDALYVFIRHRRIMEAGQQVGGEHPVRNSFPLKLMRRYEVYFKASSEDKMVPIREVKANCIGKLINIKGIVTRATEV